MAVSQSSNSEKYRRMSFDLQIDTVNVNFAGVKKSGSPQPHHKKSRLDLKISIVSPYCKSLGLTVGDVALL